MKKLFAFFGLIAIISLACNLPVSGTSNGSSSQAISQLVVTPDPKASATPTPFMPFGTSRPANEGGTARPTAKPSATPTSEAQPTLQISNDIVTVLLLGSDWRPESGYRTDTILLVAINKKTGGTSVVSFPRDLFVTLPGYRQERINVAQPLGGFELTQKTFQYNFGFTPDYYLLTNFQGFVSIINSLGGIDVYVPWELYDTCALPAQDSFGKCSVGPGQVHMDGDTALWYARSRYSTSDFDRTRRAQDIMKATFYKLMSLNAVVRAPELYNSFTRNVETNLPLDVIVSLGRFAPGLAADSDKIHQYAIGSADVWAWLTPQGAQVLLPNPDKIQPMLFEALNVE